MLRNCPAQNQMTDAVTGQERDHKTVTNILIGVQQFRKKCYAQVFTVASVIRKTIMQLPGVYKDGIAFLHGYRGTVDIIAQISLYGHQDFQFLMPVAQGGHIGKTQQVAPAE